MARLDGCIGDRRKHVIPHQCRVVAQNFFDRGAVRKKLKQVGNPHAATSDTRATSALAGLDGDSIEKGGAHVMRVPSARRWPA